LCHGGGGCYQPCHANPRPTEKSSVAETRPHTWP
jgi:hypothetical protein